MLLVGTADMVIRILLAASLVGAGVALGALVPQVSQSVRTVVQAAGWLTQPVAGGDGHGGEAQRKPDAKHGHAGKGNGHHGENHGPEGLVKMSPERMAGAKIEVAAVGKGVLSHTLSVPGTVAPDSNRIARVAAKVIGTVAELKKQLGDPVAKDETVAVLESREVAEAKSAYISAQVNFDLQRTLFEREQTLFQKNITPEQQFLRARTAFTEAQLRLDLARQKLFALGVNEREAAQLSRESQGLQRYEIRSPLAGRVVERKVDLGAPVGGEGQEKELYVIADLSSVWIDLSVSTGDLPQIREGQAISIAPGRGRPTHSQQGTEERQPVATSGSSDKRGPGKIVFISPMLNQETRSARVIAAIDNKEMTWRPGSYVTAQISVGEQPVDLRVPRSALQTIGGEQVVFVRTEEGFEKREVVLGKGDGEAVEVVFGLDPGETIALTNTFVLKAELGKAEAEHVH